MDLASFFQGKVVIITGGSQGIGKELAKQCIALDAQIVITSRSLDKLLQVKQELQIPDERILIHAGDVADNASNNALISKTLKKFGRIDCLINNAGISAYGAIDKIDLAVYKRVLDTNLYGSIAITTSCIDALKASGGSILFISSIAGLTGLPGYSAYSTAKMALRSVAQTFHIELAKHKVFVGICFIGFTQNSPDKTTLSPTGHPEPVPKRPPTFTTSQSKTASRILRQIAGKRYYSNHSLLGVFVMFMSKVFPGLTRILLKKYYKG